MSVDIRSGFTIGSICSGTGAGDLGLRLAIPGARTIFHVEREAYCTATLVRSMEEGCLAQAPVWTDAKTFNGRPWRGIVHCILATYPCQPFSCAGKQLGRKDPRHLWPHIRRIIGEAQPAMVFIENVRAHLRNGFRQVCHDLRKLGYETRAGLFSAEEMGAPHERVRLFALAYNERYGRQAGFKQSLYLRRPAGGDDAGEGSGKLAHTGRAGTGRPQDAGYIEGRRASSGAGGTSGKLGQPTGDGFARGFVLLQPGKSREKDSDARGPNGEPAIASEPGSPERRDRPGDGKEAPRIATAREGSRRQSDTSFGATEPRTSANRRDSGIPNPSGKLAAPGHGFVSQQGRQAGQGNGTRSTGAPLYFPPYRTGDWKRWEAVLVSHPWLRPALAQEETEYLLRLLADGMAPELEFRDGRTDRIRSVGNGVVPLTVAVAFTLLCRAHGFDI